MDNYMMLVPVIFLQQLDLLLEALSRHEQIDPNSLPPPLG